MRVNVFGTAENRQFHSNRLWIVIDFVVSLCSKVIEWFFNALSKRNYDIFIVYFFLSILPELVNTEHLQLEDNISIFQIRCYSRFSSRYAQETDSRSKIESVRNETRALSISKFSRSVVRWYKNIRYSIPKNGYSKFRASISIVCSDLVCWPLYATKYLIFLYHASYIRV